MPSKSLICATCTCLAIVSFSADASLISRLGGLAYYDTDADLTWLADANALVGTTYDYWIPGTGDLKWSEANTWAANLNVAGVTGWRLPDTLQPDASCDTQSTTLGSIGYNCTGSEMGNFYYNVLGGTTTATLANVHNNNYYLFSNIQGDYWSGTLAISNSAGHTFRFANNGFQGASSTYHARENAWAVQSGDVGAVPIPATAWLFGSGLIGLVGVARRKRANI